MIGQPRWFKQRKYGGWGLSPATKEGWLYIAGFIGLCVVWSILPVSLIVKNYLLYGTTAIVILDVVHIMTRLPEDEMEQRMEALAERNAAWAMVIILAVGLVYKAATATIDWFLIAPLLGGTLVKSFTNIHLGRKGL